MSLANGHADGSESGHDIGAAQLVTTSVASAQSAAAQFAPERIKDLVAQLEIPFDTMVIEWRVTNTTKNGKARGQVIPYADQRAYTDRLNAQFTPAGWTRKYTVQTSPTFERSKDQKTAAKVFVTCELTIFDLGTHSATGEEWADDENAGTSAEAQAFKRACSCFGLGRYLYHFSGVWVDLDERKRPKSVPQLFGWATPQGWRQGLRPQRQAADATLSNPTAGQNGVGPSGADCQGVDPEVVAALVRQIEVMATALGRRLYRGVLKTVARVWNPTEIHDPAVVRRVLDQMHAAERELRRLDAALKRVEPGTLVSVLRSLRLNSLEQIDCLESLKRVVLEVERAT